MYIYTHHTHINTCLCVHFLFFVFLFFLIKSLFDFPFSLTTFYISTYFFSFSFKFNFSFLSLKISFLLLSRRFFSIFLSLSPQGFLLIWLKICLVNYKSFFLNWKCVDGIALLRESYYLVQKEMPTTLISKPFIT